jgi:electron transport complex protein RnfG
VGEIIKLTLALTLVTAIAGLTVGMANINTKEQLADIQRDAEETAVSAVFPAGVKHNKMTDKGAIDDKGDTVVPNKYWVGFEDDKLMGYAFELSTRGYDAENIKFMVGVGADGKILGMTVISHNETPGLGSRAHEVSSGKYIWNPFVKTEEQKPWFTEQFEGLSSLKRIAIDKKSGEWHNLDNEAKTALKNKNTVTAITGSTITTKAFTSAIEQKVSKYIENLGGYCCPAKRKEAEAETRVSGG